jgi:hypothetical protein
MNRLLISFISVLAFSCTAKQETTLSLCYEDKPFTGEYCIRYNVEDKDTKLYKVSCDRNGYVQVYSSAGLLRPSDGKLLFPGRLVKDLQYRPVSDKEISGTGSYLDQLVYIDEKSIFSNAWAGTLYLEHPVKGAKIFTGGDDFNFIITDGRNAAFIGKSGTQWKGSFEEEIVAIKYDSLNNDFWILDRKSVNVLELPEFKVQHVLKGESLTCMEICEGKVLIGTSDGYFEIDPVRREQAGGRIDRLPCTGLTVITRINEDIWFGSANGAFKLRKDGKYDYYASRRWLPSDTVVDISAGPGNSVLILTNKGLSRINFIEMTLYTKAMFYEKQVRERHIRHGFNAMVTGMENGIYTTGSLEDSDNDGLWTAMYLAGQAFRYKVTGETEALANLRESLDAMERLYTITPVAGFPARSFERRGYKYDDKAWRRADDPEWDWKSTTSSDEAIGHIFAYSVIAELIDIQGIKNKAVTLIDTLMSTIVKNDFYLVDWNGEPTLWGKWNPSYVNARPVMVGDRKLNSSNIIAMLQTAFHFTGKEKYRKAAFYLMDQHGYLDNLMRPISEIGPAPDTADAWSKMLSEGWNHSDDEMYFCGYWGLYRYAFNDTLKAKYKSAITDHWQAERPEKEALWNILTAMTGISDPDLDEAIWYLQNYPLDLTDWTISNSRRKDIEIIDANFRGQTIREVLPPDELPVAKHNANRFRLDSDGEGRSEYSAGDIWLLPYWTGRYLNIISEPVNHLVEMNLSDL